MCVILVSICFVFHMYLCPERLETTRMSVCSTPLHCMPEPKLVSHLKQKVVLYCTLIRKINLETWVDGPRLTFDPHVHSGRGTSAIKLTHMHTCMHINTHIPHMHKKAYTHFLSADFLTPYRKAHFLCILSNICH